VDIVLNPTGCPWPYESGTGAGSFILAGPHRNSDFRAITPVFDGARENEIEAELARAWMVDYTWKETAAAGLGVAEDPGIQP